MTLSILEAAREVPDRTALVLAGTSYSYADLAERTRSAMAWLQAQGVAGDEHARVALVGTLRLDTIVFLYALMELGAPAVLVHPRLTPPERAALLEDASPASFIDDGVEVPLDGAPFDVPAPGPERALAILYTSGTSGRSKGAILSRGAFLAAARASERNLGWQDEERWLLCMPLAHVGGLSILVRALLARRCVVGRGGASFDPDAIAHVIERDRVTLASFVPTMLKKMLDRGWRCPPHLRAILLGGAAASESLLDAARKACLPVLTTYGLTEACSQVATQRLGSSPSAAQGAGEIVDGAEVRIEEGEILVRGPMLMSEYFPKDAHPDPFLPGGWFRTGDLGHLDAEGRLHVLARRTDLIVTGGENVYPREVESALERIDGVREACVFAVPDETWGALVVAALIATGTPLDDAALSSRLELSLAPHKRPRRIAWLPDFARGAQDKLDRRQTAALAMPLMQPLRKE